MAKRDRRNGTLGTVGSGTRSGAAAAPPDVQPATWLSEAALNQWRNLAPHTTPGSLTDATATAFALLCTAVASYAEADQLVQEAGMLIADGQNLIPNPALPIRERADGTIARWGRLFGLTPDAEPAHPAHDIGPRRLPHIVEG